MDRPYLQTPVEELEQIVRENTRKRPVLAQIREELQIRESERAKQLLREVNGLLDGGVPPEKPEPRQDSSDDQLELG